jgi:hypothetical protein
LLTKLDVKKYNLRKEKLLGSFCGNVGDGIITALHFSRKTKELNQDAVGLKNIGSRFKLRNYGRKNFSSETLN